MVDVNWKGRLAEWCAQTYGSSLAPRYSTSQIGGSAHSPLFECCVRTGVHRATGLGSSKKQAEQAASRSAYEELSKTAAAAPKAPAKKLPQSTLFLIEVTPVQLLDDRFRPRADVECVGLLNVERGVPDALPPWVLKCNDKAALIGTAFLKIGYAEGVGQQIRLYSPTFEAFSHLHVLLDDYACLRRLEAFPVELFPDTK